MGPNQNLDMTARRVNKIIPETVEIWLYLLYKKRPRIISSIYNAGHVRVYTLTFTETSDRESGAVPLSSSRWWVQMKNLDMTARRVNKIIPETVEIWLFLLYKERPRIFSSIMLVMYVCTH